MISSSVLCLLFGCRFHLLYSRTLTHTSLLTESTYVSISHIGACSEALQYYFKKRGIKSDSYTSQKYMDMAYLFSFFRIQ